MALELLFRGQSYRLLHLGRSYSLASRQLIQSDVLKLSLGFEKYIGTDVKACTLGPTYCECKRAECRGMLDKSSLRCRIIVQLPTQIRSTALDGLIFLR